MPVTMRGRYAVAVICSICASWLIIFGLECYQFEPNNIREHPRDELPPFPALTMDNIFWALQISDVHLSVADGFVSAKPFRAFCSETVSVTRNRWKKNGRGNHDNFDVPSLTDASNHFRKISPSWKDYKSYNYRYAHTTPFGAYSFLSLDACPSPGLRRPYNFFGILRKEEIAVLQSLAEGSRHDNHTIWFSHYPSSIITTDHHQLSKLLGTATAHVCGHLHTLGGFVPHMYGKHRDGHLELELGDFRFTQAYRLLVFDHDLFSFTDTHLGQWPLVHITNPKDARFLIPSHEPVGRMKHSSAIRILAFSPHLIVSVEVWLNGKLVSMATPVNGGPLFVLPWQPDLYMKGTHSIYVNVKDSAGQETNVSQKFSVSGDPMDLQFFPSLFILTHFQPLMKASFLCVWLCLASCLVLAAITKGSHSYFAPLVRRKQVFYPLLVYVLWYGIGPWYIGELMSGHIGAVGVHGIIIDGHFLPGSITYLHGVTHVALFQLPLTFYLNHLLSSEHHKRVLSWIWHCVYVVMVMLLPWSIHLIGHPNEERNLNET
ncbi:hypothetical protein EMCRGX_G032337 [Ephydatia muelleri]